MSYYNDDWTVVDPTAPVEAGDPAGFCARSAGEAAVATVVMAPEDTGDGRSPWFWLRTPNGDLMLACFPQGETYFDTEYDFGRH